jgi:hypothetical protein
MVAALWAAPAALADSSSSSNWAGYAIHHSGVKFRKIIGSWTQPKLTCTAGASSYSAYWIGLGGYSINSDALEQIGTEADCGPAGDQINSSWFELVPAPSRSLKISVHAGDQLSAWVSVSGHKVTLAINDETTHKSVVKTLHASSIDISSAEWITEAPSECSSATDCETLPLADFGSTSFETADAWTTKGRKGSISNHAWNRTKITLIASGQRFVGYNSGDTSGIATPSALADNGSAFTVTYSAGSDEGGGPPLESTDLRSYVLKR